MENDGRKNKRARYHELLFTFLSVSVVSVVQVFETPERCTRGCL